MSKTEATNAAVECLYELNLAPPEVEDELIDDDSQIGDSEEELSEIDDEEMVEFFHLKKKTAVEKADSIASASPTR